MDTTDGDDAMEVNSTASTPVPEPMDTSRQEPVFAVPKARGRKKNAESTATNRARTFGNDPQELNVSESWYEQFGGDHGEHEENADEIKDTVNFRDALGEKFESHCHGKLEGVLPLNYVPIIDPDNQIQSDCITFALMDYIRRDDRNIGLLSSAFWDEGTRATVGSDDPMDYLVVKPPGICDFLVIPAWSGCHYVLFVMHYDSSKKAISCYFADSARGSSERYESLLKVIAQRVFCVIARARGEWPLNIVNISHQSVYQDLSVDWINCAAFTAHNAIEFLETRKAGRKMFLRPNEKDGDDFRLDLALKLLPIFGYSEEAASLLLSETISNQYMDAAWTQVHQDANGVSDEEEPILKTVTVPKRKTKKAAKKSSQPPKMVFKKNVPDNLFDGFATPLPERPAHPKRKSPNLKQPGMVLRNKRVIQPPKPKLPKYKPTIKRGPGRPKMDGAAAISLGNLPNELDVGPLDYPCKFCGALRFADESPSGCCHDGKVKIASMPPYPESVNKLLINGPRMSVLTDEEREENKWMKSHIRVVNSLLSLGSITYDTKDSGVKRMLPKTLVNGEFNYHVSRLTPLRVGEPLRNAQLYTITNPMSEDVVDELLRNEFYTRLDGGDMRDRVVSRMYDVVREHNPLAQGYKMAYDRLQQMQEYGQVDYVIRFVENHRVPAEMRQGLHDRQINVPETAEAAMIFHGIGPDELIPPGPKGIWMYSHEDIPKVRFPKSPVLLSLTNTLPFLYGDMLYRHDLPLQKPENEEDFGEDMADQLNLSNLRGCNSRQTAVQEYSGEMNGTEDLPFIPFGDHFRRGQDDEEDQNGEAVGEARHKRVNCSVRQQCMYRFERREIDNGIHPIWIWGTVGHFIAITSHFEIIRSEIDYYADQVEKRVISSKALKDKAQQLLDKKVSGKHIGYVKRIPRRHKLSGQYNQRTYSNALAMTRKFGSPTFFITVTGNQGWEDYRKACQKVGADPASAPDLMMRVFELKLKKLMNMITGTKNGGKGIFGKCVAYLVSIEYQKRGNPHAHMLFWIEDREETAAYVDDFISARVPGPKDDSFLHNLVRKYMLHVCSPDSVCRNRDTKKCTRYYPQRERTSTLLCNGFVKYRRVYARNGGHNTFKGNKQCGDGYVVPYNPYLLMLWNGHANVEYVVSTGTPAYVIKYVLKGNSKVFVEILKKGIDGNPYVEVKGDVVNVDESRYFLKMNYISVEEALGLMRSLGPFMLSHSVHMVGVHLPKDVTITCADGETIENMVKWSRKVEKDCYSRLTAWFTHNKKHPDEAPDLTYIEFNEVYNYDPKTLLYSRVKRSSKRVVSMYDVNVKNIQLVALRTILLTAKGLKCFEDAATVGDVVFRNPETDELDFVSAAQVMGLMESDFIWRNALDQVKFCTARRVIFCFAQILLEGGALISNARQLWEDYKQFMRYPLGAGVDEDTVDEIKRRRDLYSLSILKWHLEDGGKKLSDFGLPEPDDIPAYDPDRHGEAAVEFLQGNEHGEDAAQAIPEVALNDEQKFVFETIWKAIEDAGNEKNMQEPKQFFMTGPGGVGKTTIYGQLIKKCLESGSRVITTASTGVAASLLPNGNTLHSRFFIPTDERIHKEPHMPADCQDAAAIRECALLIVDEATQISRFVYDYMKKTLLSVRRSDHPEVSRRLVIVFGGDFRQLLPVLPGQTEDEVFDLSLASLYRDGSTRILALKQNQRAAGAEQESFRNALLDIGQGRNSVEVLDERNYVVELPAGIECVGDVDALIERVFPAETLDDPTSWAMSGIVAPLNTSKDEINRKIVAKLPGEPKEYYAINTPSPNTVDPFDYTSMESMAEYMAQIDENGLPMNLLTLKVGQKVMFTRNVAKRFGLCNGTPAIVRELRDDVITVQRISNDGKLGELVDVLRCRVERKVDLRMKKYFSFSRIQFPLAPAFAMTVHKAQGQTFDRVGVFLNSPMFSPGQLYVALSRARNAQSITVFNPDDTRMVQNVVHPEVKKLLDDLEKDENAHPPRR